MATKMAMTFGDYAITEAGFGADLGAEMVVAIAGDIIRMQGLPKHPQALDIDVENGFINGLS